MKSAARIKITQCLSSDLEDLRNISRSTFISSYAHKNEPAGFNAYVEKAFDINQLKNELETKNSFFYFVFSEAQLIGYLKLNIAPAQSDFNDPFSLEIERIYLLKAFQGKGIGRQVMHFIEDQARQHSKSYIWLGVWTKNPEAVRFYEKLGFAITGVHNFVVGTEVQDDHVMQKQIEQ